MDNILLLTGALEFMEQNLTENIKTDDIAQALYCSKSTIEKLFKYATNMSIRDYIIRRRMSRAAKEIAGGSGESFLNLAVKYGYGSNEAFTRAFQSVWHVTPSEYKSNPTRYELFPAWKLDADLMEDEKMRDRKKVDISELYDFIGDRKNCYFIGCDIKSLIPINDISFEAGDIAILTAMKRMEEELQEEDVIFRIGGDEFVAITHSEDKAYADSAVERILSHNEEPIVWEGREIPLSLYAVAYKLDITNMKYSELFTTMQEILTGVKQN